jgi:hypothetical protein
MTDRDHFAAAALTGLVGECGYHSPEDVAGEAYALADAMLRERGQENHDAAPAARAEIERLREAIRRLADQEATLSVCDGSVTVTMDATLTDEERAAIWTVAEAYAANDGDPECEGIARAMHGLWQRTK